MPAPSLISTFLISWALMGAPQPDPGVAAKDLKEKGRPATAEADARTPAILDEPAVELPLSGVSVQLECFAYADGRVGDCVVLHETRPGLGFGEAAVAMMNGAFVGAEVPTGRATRVKFLHTIEFTPD